jgi:hypothetical protein
VPESPPIIAAEEARMAPIEPFEAAAEQPEERPNARPKARSNRKRPPRNKKREADSAGEGPPTGGS